MQNYGTIFKMCNQNCNQNQNTAKDVMELHVDAKVYRYVNFVQKPCTGMYVKECKTKTNVWSTELWYGTIELAFVLYK